MAGLWQKLTGGRGKNPAAPAAKTVATTVSATGAKPPPVAVQADPLARRGLRAHAVLSGLFQQRKLGGFDTLRVIPAHRYLAMAVRLHQTEARKAVVTEQFMEDLAMTTGSQRVRVWRDRAALIYEFELPEMYWRYYNVGQVPAGSIGIAGIGRAVSLDFDDAHPHAGVFGGTGSGKTTTIKMALYALARRYEPEQMQFAICDPNRWFADEFRNLAHLYAPVAVQRDEAETLIRQVYAEYLRRQRGDIKDAGRLVLVFDEATENIPEPGRREDEISRMVSDMARLGRGFKVSILLGTQEPNKTRFPGIFSQIQNRYLGKVDNASASANLSGQAQLFANKLTGRGDFLHIQPNGEGLRFQAAFVTPADLDRLPRAEVRPLPPVRPEIVDIPGGEEPPPAAGGRPRTSLSPATLAKYYLAWPELPSYRQAEAMGVTRQSHNLHRSFVTQFIKHLEAK